MGKFVIIICDSGRAYDLALRALKHAKLDCANLTINPFVYSENHIAASDYSIKSVYNLKNQSTQKILASLLRACLKCSSVSSNGAHNAGKRKLFGF